jgi:hypothetical protein
MNRRAPVGPLMARTWLLKTTSVDSQRTCNLSEVQLIIESHIIFAQQARQVRLMHAQHKAWENEVFLPLEAVLICRGDNF